MNCKEKDGLLIFLLVFCGILFAVLGILIFFLLKNKSKWGNATNRAIPEDGVDIDEEQQKEKKNLNLGRSSPSTANKQRRHGQTKKCQWNIEKIKQHG